MKRTDAEKLISIRDAIARAYDVEAVDDMIADARDRYASIPEDRRDGEKADDLLSEIARLTDIRDACEQLASAFSALLDERASA